MHCGHFGAWQSPFVFPRRRKVIQVWSDMKLSKWWQNAPFSLSHSHDTSAIQSSYPDRKTHHTVSLSSLRIYYSSSLSLNAAPRTAKTLVLIRLIAFLDDYVWQLGQELASLSPLWEAQSARGAPRSVFWHSQMESGPRSAWIQQSQPPAPGVWPVLFVQQTF